MPKVPLVFRRDFVWIRGELTRQEHLHRRVDLSWLLSRREYGDQLIMGKFDPFLSGRVRLLLLVPWHDGKSGADIGQTDPCQL